MLKKERHAYILHQLNLHNKVLNAVLCADLGVSEDTVRRDLQELSDAGGLIKVHGGALSTAFYNVPFSNTEIYSQPQKKIIALKAMQLLKEGMFLLTSGGTTLLELVRTLPLNFRATLLTGSIPIINAAVLHPQLELIVIGDKLSKDSKITVGAGAIEKISQIRADLCFLGTNAIDTQFGITDSDWEVVQVKKAMVAASAETICLAISEKLQSVQPIQVCQLEKIKYLITELEPNHPKLKPYWEKGITVL